MVFELNFRILGAAVIALVAMGLAGVEAGECGGEVCPGTMVDATNIDKLKGEKFEGRVLGEMIPDRLEWQIRQYGMAIKLANARAYAPDPRFQAATERYAKDVKFDPATGDMTDWVAGAPFPDIDVADPSAGIKVIWNLMRGRRRGDIIDQPQSFILLIDPEKGVERIQEWSYLRFGMAGNFGAGAAPIRGDGTIFEKVMLFAVSPQDIKGVGTFTIRYTNGRLDDTWAYVREVRRTRRLSGGSWMEPVGSMDLNGDDFGSFNAYPTWYKKFELLGKKTILVVGHAQRPFLGENTADPVQRFPRIDLANAPHWNVSDQWEPREVYIVKCTPKDAHPYGYKIVYVDAQAWSGNLSYIYDKKGDHLKSQVIANDEWPMEDDVKAKAVYEVYVDMVDFQKRHSSAYYTGLPVRLNGSLAEDAVSLSALEALGR